MQDKATNDTDTPTELQIKDSADIQNPRKEVKSQE
jgi:hypothetical protein